MFDRSLLLAAVAGSSLLAPGVRADILKGVVVGTNNAPKPAVFVDIFGPTRIFTETNQEGRFSVEVTAGIYTVRIRDGSRRVEFPGIAVPRPNEAEVRLTVAW